MEVKIARKVDDMDNVATIFANDVLPGTPVQVRDKAGNLDNLIVSEAIPYGHKIAVADIPRGAPIIKYGESIGAASCSISKGAYVHIHNLDAMRGRGDL